MILDSTYAGISPAQQTLNSGYVAQQNEDLWQVDRFIFPQSVCENIGILTLKMDYINEFGEQMWL